MDWNRVILNLNRLGLSDTAIAKKLDVSKQTINGLKNMPGRGPRYALGAAILALYSKTSGEAI